MSPTGETPRAMTHEDAPPPIYPVRWRDAPVGALVRDEIELVLAPHDAPAALMPALAALLTPLERAWADRYVGSVARERAIVSRATLRLLLAQYLGIAPRSLDIAVDCNGKPLVRHLDATGRPLAFNLAHAGGLLLFGFARQAVGVDIEPVRPIPRLDAFVRTALGERERAFHATLPAERRLDHAYRVWVGKEALVKRSGEGVRRDFASFDLIEKEATIFVPEDGFVAAVAGENRGALRFRRVMNTRHLLPDGDTADR